ncbi:Rv3654c family TadE-like protein [Terrabacter sp. GCM10028922]|uniref:Rv3654c family TadE-like protein n=1 Tax=Terrabacter sp. GCM10028922 TaxID=3273428 RepID=UPI003609B8F6
MTQVREGGRLRGRARDAGAATVLVVGLVAALLVLTAGALVIASAVVASHRARMAGDLAALAGAAALQDSADGGRACAVADRVARANGAALQGCSSGADASITVRVTVGAALWPRPASARSRAGPEPSGPE